MNQAKPNLILKAFNKVVSSISILGSIWIVVLMVIILADVVGRGLFNNPIFGITEVVKNSLVGLTFLQLAHVLREGRHIRTTILLDYVSPQWKKVLQVISNLFGMIIFAIISHTELQPALKAFQSGEFEGSLVRIPTYPTHFLILIGSFFMAVQFALLLYKELTVKSDMSTKKEQV